MAPAAVVDVVAAVHVAVAVVVAVPPPGPAGVLALAVDALGAVAALVAAAAAVVGVILDVDLAAVAVEVVVAVPPAVDALGTTPAIGAGGLGVGERGALPVAVAAVVHVVGDAGLAGVGVVIVAALERGLAPRVRGTCTNYTTCMRPSSLCCEQS